MDSQLYRCDNFTWVESGSSAAIGGMLFGAGLLGNVLALILLTMPRLRSCPPSSPPSVFYVLVCGLAITDLMGKCLLSPMVLATYTQNRTLRELVPGSRNLLCHVFAFFMAFFGLASMLQLLVMALECWLSLGYPFFYQRHITLPRGVLVAPAVGVFCFFFCALPLVGFGKYVQYCPGTWCFIQMASEQRSLSVEGYSILYATLMAMLVLATVLCNLNTMRNLYGMHERFSHLPRSVPKDLAGFRGKQKESAHTLQPLEALDHLLLLAVMTVLFTICSLPFIVRAYFGAFSVGNNKNVTLEEKEDLRALRFLSVNSIVDPWVFIICRTSVFRLFFRKFLRKPLTNRSWSNYNSCKRDTESNL
ncbi:prostaglandin D2 receptor [Dromiciops gliroides]|uniref:prostaglandin D2 receptor n=1 Tax=Dromiciops gliroides TaxID=33562 RepID=UPI001CC7445E|nr:prostaglandin D2 receptor [Dromiciops gliroides]